MDPSRAWAQGASFALLDDASAPEGTARSRLYTGWQRSLHCDDPATLDALWADLQAAQSEGLHAVLLADYEWGARLGGVSVAPQVPGRLEILLYAQCETLDRVGVARWLQQADSGGDQPGAAGFSRLQASVDDDAFHQAIERIHALIRAGETYQINYTYRLEGQAWGEPIALYRHLRQRQPVPFGALIRRPPRDDGSESGWILSCSPELFLTHRQGQLTTRPMKGTAARLDGPEADNAIAFWLADDEKNRAENLMIVDLLRNDIGRIARIGSVKVPQLFAVEPYRTVYQMTSTVQGELPPETGLAEVLRALFPCGSITGAPKRHTMGLISQLETSPRGLYTGAIGWIDAPADTSRALGDFTFSVAIRTVELGASQPDGTRPARLGVGAGITLDSQAEDEARECRLKARYATQMPHAFTLFETLRAEDGQIAGLADHLGRLEASAQALGFAFERAQAQGLLRAHLESAGPVGPQRLRLDLSSDGRLSLRAAALVPLPEGPVRVGWWTGGPLDTPAALQRHKTSIRSCYDAAIAEAEAEELFDLLFTDADGWLTEGARTSVFVRLGGRWFTPPAASGRLLPGVMRARLLGDASWSAQERPIHRDEVERAEALCVCNALRGALNAQLFPRRARTAHAPRVA